MIYSANITTELGGSKEALSKTTINVTKGLVYKVEFLFPSGSAGLMGIAVFDGLFQVWPSSVGEFFVGDGVLISFEDMYLKESAPYQFQCYTYNEDDRHNHLVSVRIGMVSKEIFYARYLPQKSQELFIQSLTQMEAERQALLRVQREQRLKRPFKWMLQ